MNAVKFTARQATAWPEAIERLRQYYPVPEAASNWSIVHANEIRPGRGHFINATFIDGEVFAQVTMDVYGHPDVSIAFLEWVHADGNEECDCNPCRTERYAEDTQ